jgi:hypothetical protein
MWMHQSLGSWLRARDADSPWLAFDIDVGPIHGTVELGRNGRFTYRPRRNFVGVDRFRFIVTDHCGATGTAEVALDVRGEIAQGVVNEVGPEGVGPAPEGVEHAQPDRPVGPRLGRFNVPAAVNLAWLAYAPQHYRTDGVLPVKRIGAVKAGRPDRPGEPSASAAAAVEASAADGEVVSILTEAAPTSAATLSAPWAGARSARAPEVDDPQWRAIGCDAIAAAQPKIEAAVMTVGGAMVWRHWRVARPRRRVAMNLIRPVG